MLWRMSVDSHRQRIGIMFACLDDRLHRPRSGAQHADAPVVDFPAQCSAKEFAVAAGRARAIPCRTPAAPNSLDGALGCDRKIKERRKGQKGRQPSGGCQAVCGLTPRVRAVGNWQDASGNCGNCRNGSAGCCPQPWIPVSGDQHFGLQCFFVQCFQGLGVSQAIILRAGPRCHRTVTSS
jgi:hypothetical protein